MNTITSSESLFEFRGDQLEAIINWFAASPNITSVELDDVELSAIGLPDRIYFTVNYRDKANVPIILDAGDEFPKVGLEH